MTDARGDATREALISAAIAVFSRDGFHDASTRAIAEPAGVQHALIGYHFPGKEGLYLAAFEHIAQLVGRLGPVVDGIEETLAKPTKVTAKGSPGPPPPQEHYGSALEPEPGGREAKGDPCCAMTSSSGALAGARQGTERRRGKR